MKERYGTSWTERKRRRKFARSLMRFVDNLIESNTGFGKQKDREEEGRIFDSFFRGSGRNELEEDICVFLLINVHDNWVQKKFSFELEETDVSQVSFYTWDRFLFFSLKKQ